MYLISHWCFLFAAGIAAVGGIKAVGEWARNFVLGLHAPLLQSFIVSRGPDISPVHLLISKLAKTTGNGVTPTISLCSWVPWSVHGTIVPGRRQYWTLGSWYHINSPVTNND